MGVRFDTSRARVLAAHAAMAAAERECLGAAVDQLRSLCAESGLEDDPLVVLHAVPRGAAVWDVDDRDCSRDDAVLEAVDLVDAAGTRLRLGRSGLGPLRADGAAPAPRTPLQPLVPVCFGTPGPAAARSRVVTGVTAVDEGAPMGGPLWERAVLAWVDLHRALSCWTGRTLAPTLVVLPTTGDVGSVEPLYCPDQGQDFEVVTSLRLAPDAVPADDLEAALANLVQECEGTTPDAVETELLLRMQAAGLPLPGYPAHAPGCCDLSDGEV